MADLTAEQRFDRIMKLAAPGFGEKELTPEQRQAMFYALEDHRSLTPGQRETNARKFGGDRYYALLKAGDSRPEITKGDDDPLKFATWYTRPSDSNTAQAPDPREEMASIREKMKTGEYWKDPDMQERYRTLAKEVHGGEESDE